MRYGKGAKTAYKKHKSYKTLTKKNNSAINKKKKGLYKTLGKGIIDHGPITA